MAVSSLRRYLNCSPLGPLSGPSLVKCQSRRHLIGGNNIICLIVIVADGPVCAPPSGIPPNNQIRSEPSQITRNCLQTPDIRAASLPGLASASSNQQQQQQQQQQQTNV